MARIISVANQKGGVSKTTTSVNLGAALHFTFNKNETYRNLYYQLPKILFTSEFYKNMSNDSKDGHIYSIFTRNELMDILGSKENKIAKIY